MTDKFYQANGIVYHRNVQSVITKHIEDVLRPINEPLIRLREDLAKEIEETNRMLVEDIQQSNTLLAGRSLLIVRLLASRCAYLRTTSGTPLVATKPLRTFACMKTSVGSMIARFVMRSIV